MRNEASKGMPWRRPLQMAYVCEGTLHRYIVLLREKSSFIVICIFFIIFFLLITSFCTLCIAEVEKCPSSMWTTKANESVANSSCNGSMSTSSLGETLDACNPTWSGTILLLGAVLLLCYCRGWHWGLFTWLLCSGLGDAAGREDACNSWELWSTLEAERLPGCRLRQGWQRGQQTAGQPAGPCRGPRAPHLHLQEGFCSGDQEGNAKCDARQKVHTWGQEWTWKSCTVSKAQISLPPLLISARFLFKFLPI